MQQCTVQYTVHIRPVFVYKYSIQYSTVSCPSASAPTVAGLVLMRRRFRLFLGQDIFSRNETFRNTFLIQKRLCFILLIEDIVKAAPFHLEKQYIRHC